MKKILTLLTFTQMKHANTKQKLVYSENYVSDNSKYAICTF